MEAEVKVCAECGALVGECECDLCSEKKKKKGDSYRVDVLPAPEDWMTQPFERTPEGFLMGRPIVTNVGVFQYQGADGKMHGELRHPEDVFDVASIESLKLKPVTNEHPKELVTTDNIGEFVVGSLGSNPSFTDQRQSGGDWARGHELMDGKHLAIDMVITDANTIADILNGKRALSCGYTLDVEPVSGTYLGMPYEGRQRNIRYNHVAVVDRARAGDAARIRMDGADRAISIHTHKEGEDMKKVKIDGKDYEVEAVVADALTSQTDRANTLQSKVDAAEADKAKLEAERDTAKARADSAEAESKRLKGDTSAVQAAVKARRTIERVAQDAGVEFTDEDSNVDLQRKVVNKVFPKLDVKEREEAYVSAAFDSAVSALEVKVDSKNTETVKGERTDGERVDSEKSRQDMIARLTGRKGA